MRFGPRSRRAMAIRVRCWQTVPPSAGATTPLGSWGTSPTTNSSTPVVCERLTTAIAMRRAVPRVRVGERDRQVLGLATAAVNWGTAPRGLVGASPGEWLDDSDSDRPGGGYSCALLADGTAKCWGRRLRSSWGTAPPPSSSTPVMVSVLDERIRHLGGLRSYVCVVGERDRQVLGRQRRRRVGERHHDQLVDAGRGERYRDRDRDLRPATAHSCALLANGTAKCWGCNTIGQLGNGTHDASRRRRSW